jgi:Uma2 family endonuclease
LVENPNHFIAFLAPVDAPSVSCDMREFRPGLGPLTIDEYLAWEADAGHRHELVAGRVYAMVGGTLRHNRIAMNIIGHLRAATAGGVCVPYAADIKVRAARDRVYYPDCLLLCASHHDDDTVVDDPCLIVEVTSSATRRVDRGEKLDAYLGIHPLRGYLIAESDRRHVTLYTRQSNGEWVREEAVTTGDVLLPCVDSRLSLDEIYDGADPPLRVREDAEDELVSS